MATNFRVKMGEIGGFTFICRLNGVEYRNSDFNRFICDDLPKLFKNLTSVH